MKTAEKKYVSTQNPCKLCAPLGASLAFKGFDRTIPVLHGSQGCSTYVRRYLISHFREPVDIASTNFSEDTAIFGGGENLHKALDNIIRQYSPSMIGIATTCLTETIGDDVPMFLREYFSKHDDLPEIVNVSTPSYSGTHIDGFHAAVLAVVKKIAADRSRNDSINIFPNMVSSEDIRHIREIGNDFGIPLTVMPDYSSTLDGGMWSEYQKIPAGGTKIEDVAKSAGALASIEFSSTVPDEKSAGAYLNKEFGVPFRKCSIPIGIEESDMFFSALSDVSGKDIPMKYREERMRLVDAYADGHKYVFGSRAIVYGEEDFVYSITKFLLEVGVIPLLCASGGKSGALLQELMRIAEFNKDETMVKDGIDFVEIGDLASELNPDFIIGSSKGYPVSRKMNLPLIRVGFPIHDRFGGQRVLHIGYRGTQNLYDMLVNTLLSYRQDSSPVGYFYM